MRAQSMEFSELNVEFGYMYDSGAVVSDGTPTPVPVDDIRVYEPSTRPGSPLPHAWIDLEDGNRLALRDLVAPGRFLLIAERTATRGARPPVSWPRSSISRSTRSASGISTATSSTRAARGYGTARSPPVAPCSSDPIGSSPGVR